MPRQQSPSTVINKQWTEPDHQEFSGMYILVRCIQDVGGKLEQAIDFNVASCEKHCTHKERKNCTDVFKVT